MQGTHLSYTLPNDAHVQVKVYNAMGGEVATVVDENAVAGQHTVPFNPPSLASGTYYARLMVDGQMAGTTTLMLTK